MLVSKLGILQQDARQQKEPVLRQKKLSGPAQQAAALKVSINPTP